MKENIFEVLIYLFENYLETVDDAITNSNKIRDELLSAGFEQKEVDINNISIFKINKTS